MVMQQVQELFTQGWNLPIKLVVDKIDPTPTLYNIA